MIRKIFILFLIFSCGLCQTVAANPEAKRLQAKAFKAAQNGDLDFSYMYYRNILRNYPDSDSAITALFAEGEYYYQQEKYQKASRAFKTYLERAEKNSSRLFALAYLLKTSEQVDKTNSREDIKRQIITQQQLGFLFKDEKTFYFRSPLNHHYKAVVRINSIAFYKNEKIFTQIQY